MKKLSVIVAMALAVVANYSCGEYDNPADGSGSTTITDANGNPLAAAATLQVNAAGEELTATIAVNGNETVALKSGDNVATPDANGAATIEVGENGIVEVLTNGEITKLSIVNEGLTSIDLGSISTLEELNLSGNQLNSIDLSENYDLAKLDLSSNALTSINLKNNYKLETVQLNNNQLTSIELSNAYDKLVELNASFNQLTSFDASKTRALETLNLSNNQLAGEINLVGSAYKSVDLSSNNLTAVKASKVAAYLNVAGNNLIFSTLPVVTPETYIYAPQKDYTPVINGGILDLSSEKTIAENETAYETDFEKGEDFDEYELIFAFVKAVDGKIALTNATFPGLTINALVATGAASNTIYAWAADETAGAQITAVRTKLGTADDDVNYIGYIGDETKNYYNTIRVNGTKTTIEGGDTTPKYFNYILVELDQPLQEGNVLRFTGFRNTHTSGQAGLYLLFDLLNDNTKRIFNDYRPGDNNTIEFQYGEMFPNIWENGLVPQAISTLIVDKTLAGSKSFKIARNNDAQTEIFLTNVEVLRRAE